MDLKIFNSQSLFNAGTEFFEQLGVNLNSNTTSPLSAKAILKEHFKDNPIFNSIKETYFLGLIDNSIFTNSASISDVHSLDDSLNKVHERYEGIMVFAVKLENHYPTRTDIANLTRAFNRASKKVPVIVLLHYNSDGNSFLTFSTTERIQYQQTWREGEKLGKVSLLRDINIEHPHT
ncbi:MAG: hypothetical protein N3A61_07910, partial [Ignavibacteria bacterium]|nr:hypothetical protein [Ignavibacteria bacterium]